MATFRIALFLLMLMALPAHSTITGFGTTSNPADNAVLTDAAARTVTPPASMVAGQLIAVRANVRNSTETITQATTCGQTWNEGTNRQGNVVTSRFYWAIFNGTWTCDPSWRTAGQFGSAFTIIMSVFSPTAGSGFVADQAESFATVSAATTITITGQTSTGPSASIADWISDGDTVTFSGLTGGWSTAGGAQIRSTQGTGTSSARAYKIQSAGATGNVSNTASVSTSGQKLIITFKEVADPEFTVAPDVVSRTDSSYTAAATTNINAVFKGVALRKDADPPTCPQVVAGTDADDNPALATCSVNTTAGVSANCVLGGLTFPVHDLYFCAVAP